jgi:hypothetical protein
VIKELGGTKAFIITGRSLYEKTPVIKNIEKSLGSAHGGTFSKIGQHAYVYTPINYCSGPDVSTGPFKISAKQQR